MELRFARIFIIFTFFNLRAYQNNLLFKNYMSESKNNKHVLYKQHLCRVTYRHDSIRPMSHNNHMPCTIMFRTVQDNNYNYANHDCKITTK